MIISLKNQAKRVVAWFVIGGVAAAFLSGCASFSEDPHQSTLPWNEPAGWEHSGFRVPM